MSIVFEQAEGNGIAYCFTDFRIAHVDYTVVFSDDADSLVYFHQNSFSVAVHGGKMALLFGRGVSPSESGQGIGLRFMFSPVS